MIKRLFAIDFDGTLMNTPSQDKGRIEWEKKRGEIFKHKGWWSKPESLDLNIFDIKPFPKILNILKNEINNPESYVIILTSRIEKLRPEVQKILDFYQINVDRLDMLNDNRDKGDKILDYIKEFPDINEINVYDDREKEIITFKRIKNAIPVNIQFNIYKVVGGFPNLIGLNDNLINVIQEEILKLNNSLGFISDNIKK